jgi:hypothetical protein
MQGNPARRAAVKLAIAVNAIGHAEIVSQALDRLLQSERKEDIADLLAFVPQRTCRPRRCAVGAAAGKCLDNR